LLGSILGGVLTVGAAVALLVGCFLYRKSRRFTIKLILCSGVKDYDDTLFDWMRPPHPILTKKRTQFFLLRKFLIASL